MPRKDRAHPAALVSADALCRGLHFPAPAERQDVVDLLHGIRVIALRHREEAQVRRHNPQVVVARNEEDVRKPGR